MNFASLHKHHQNRETEHNSVNQFMVNCNHKSQHGNVKIENKFSGIKKRLNEPNCLKMIQIYDNFEVDQNAQWILQMQSRRIKVHRFRPSKIKDKKQSTSNLAGHYQPSRQTQYQKQYMNFDQPSAEQQSEDILTYLNKIDRNKYSQMNKPRQNKLGKEQRWIQSPNQNKFSFGDDSKSVSEFYQSKTLQEANLTINRQAQDFIPQKPQQQIHQLGQNLMKQLQKSNQTQNIHINNEQTQHQHQQNKKTIINQPAITQTQLKTQSNKAITKVSQAYPRSLFDLDIDAGFSFDEIDKMRSSIPNQKVKQFQELGQQVMAQKGLTCVKRSPFLEIDTLVVKVQQNKLSELRENALERVIWQADSLSYKSSQEVQFRQSQLLNLNYQIRPRQTPNRIYCKANVRNLTPQKQKFKYPRVDSKIQTNSQIKPFLQYQAKNHKTQDNTVLTRAVQNVQSKQQECGGRELQTFIEGPKMLLQERQRMKGNQQMNLDGVMKVRTLAQKGEVVMLGGFVNLQKQKFEVVALVTNTQYQPQIYIHSPPMQQKLQKIQLQITQYPKQFTLNNLTPLRSPTKQKPKPHHHNQLANMQTNHTSDKRLQMNANRPTTPKTTTTNYVRYTEKQINNQMDSIRPCQQQRQTNQQFKSNYACKPLGIPLIELLSTQINNKISYSQQGLQEQQNIGQISSQRNVHSHPVYPQQAVPVRTYRPYFAIGNTSTNINKNNNKITTNPNTYDSKRQQKQKENLRPETQATSHDKFSRIQGMKCVESRNYQLQNIGRNYHQYVVDFQDDPKQSSVEFSLRIQDHFHLGGK